MAQHTFVRLRRHAVQALRVMALRGAIFFLGNSSLIGEDWSLKVGLGDFGEMVTGKDAWSGCGVVEVSRVGGVGSITVSMGSIGSDVWWGPKRVRV